MSLKKFAASCGGRPSELCRAHLWRDGREGAPPAGGRPLFIAVTQDDPAVPATESLKIYASWTAASLPAELHVYERGRHGFGMRRMNLPVDGWTAAFEAWMKSHGWLTKPATAAAPAK
jgi:acetyl esterase/lipase